MSEYYLDENKWYVVANPYRITGYTRIPASWLTARCREVLKDTLLYGTPAKLPVNDHNLSNKGKAGLKESL